MKHLSLLTLLLACLMMLTSCRPDDEIGELDNELKQALSDADALFGGQGFQLPASTDFDAIPQDPANPLTVAKVLLGQQLYHETGLAINPLMAQGEGTYSCASCHFAEAGFQAGRFQGIGEGGSGIGANGANRIRIEDYQPSDLDVQPVRTPTTLNVAYQELMLWNGGFGATGQNIGTEAEWREETPQAVNHLGYHGVESQAIAGLGVHRLGVDKEWLDEVGYTTMFDEAFSDRIPEERYTAETAGLAIAAYERTLLPNEAPFQKYLQGELSALSEMEKRGALLFFGQAQCVSCHNGPALTSMSFHAIGMDDLDRCGEETYKVDEHTGAHLGRGSFTKQASDNYKFKTPSIYNLSDSPFYGHGASFRTVQEVIEYKNAAVSQNDRVPDNALSPWFQPLELTAAQIEELSAFVTYSLHDDNLERYKPDALLSGLCFPNNDYQSRIDQGCE